MKAKHFRSVTTARLFVTATLLAASLAALAPPPVAHAATFTVNTTADTDDANKGDGVCADSGGACSLRAAISEANALAGADTITLPAGTYTLTRAGAGENNNATGDLDLKSAITLNGAGANNTVIDANQIDRVLQVFGGATVELNGVKLTNGRTPNLDADGGGVLNSGNLTIRNCIISNNTTGHYGSGGRGGGVSSSGTLTIENSTIRDNVTGDADTSGFPGGYGGGVYIEDGTATIRDSTISGNTTGNGFTSGDDGYGGGVYVRTGTVTIENSTISGNAAKGYSGGVHYRLATAVVTLTHCTITGNTADADADSAFGHGGGIGGGVGSMNVKNTIVSGNTDRGQSDTNDCNVDPAHYTSQGYNLVGSGTGCPSDGTGDQTTSDAKLGPMQDNGGPTQTHAPQYNSPAVEVIPSGANGCGTDYTTDQRGAARPGGATCDVGAYETPYLIWDGGGVDNDTSTAANWKWDTAPDASDVPVFYNVSSKNAAVDTNLTVAGWLMATGYGGTISQGSSNLTVNGDWTQAAGTFSGGSGTLDISGAFDFSGWTFNAPSALMCVAGGFHHTGGTFNPNGGRVVLDNTSNQTLATTFNDLVINDGLVGYWKLDEGSGVTAYDSSGYGYNGTLQNGPTWSTDTPATMDFHDPSSLSFSGSGSAQSVDIAGTPLINSLQHFTLAAWVKMNTMGASSYRFVYLRGDKASLRYHSGGPGQLEFFVQIDGVIQNLRVNNVLSAGSWLHVAGSYDGATMRAYVNGTEVGSLPIAGTVITAVDGVRLTSPDQPLDGRLDDVRIYSRALSLTEIQALANGQHPDTSQATTTLGANLDVNGDLTLNSGTLDVKLATAGYWKFDEGSGTTAADSSGHGHTGTLIHMEDGDWVADKAPTNFSNLYALQFDGVDEYVDAAIDVSETAYALSLWFKTSCTNCGIFSVDDGTLGSNGSDRHIYLNAGNLCARTYSDETICTSGTSYANGAWHHLVHTFGGAAGGQKLYVDGAQKASGSKAASDFTWQTGVNIGFSNDASSDYFSGLIDDVRVYNGALSPEQVQTLANGDEVYASINVAGDFTRNGGVFNARSGTVTFDGSGTQTLDTDTIAFYNLTVNSGSTLLDAAEFTVNHTLTNNGALQRTQTVNGSSDVSFFNTGGYGGVILNANGTDLGSTTVTIKGNQDCTSGTSGSSVKRCFDIAPANTSGLNATMRLYFSASELGSTTCSGMQVWRWNGSSWETAGTSPSRQCTTEPYYVQVTGVSSFSPFVADNDEPGAGPTVVTLRAFGAHSAPGATHLGSASHLLLALVALGAVGMLLWARRRKGEECTSNETTPGSNPGELSNEKNRKEVLK